MTWLALLILILVALGAVAFVATARRGAVDRATDLTEGMDADSRSLYGPIRRLVDEIEATVARGDSVAIRIVGQEAVQEAKRIREQCARALVARTELKRAGRGRSVAEQEVEDLTQRAESATSEAERQALEGAREARQLELGHYDKVTTTIAHIDSGVRQAEAALSEMKARLAVSSGSEKALSAGDEELRDTVGRLKSLSVSYAEAEQTLNSL